MPSKAAGSCSPALLGEGGAADQAAEGCAAQPASMLHHGAWWSSQCSLPRRNYPDRSNAFDLNLVKILDALLSEGSVGVAGRRGGLIRQADGEPHAQGGSTLPARESGHQH
jgi:hypothetical protein